MALATMTPVQSSLGSVYLTSTITSIDASVTVIIALLYLMALYILSHHVASMKVEKSVNQSSTFRLQTIAPFIYLLVVLGSLAEISVSAWLIAQYSFNHNYPNIQTRTSVYITLACACWTCITAASCLILFIHPIWKALSLASVGAQAIWTFLTWVFWITCTAIMDKTLPFGLVSADCGLVYCGQLQALFALAVVQIVVLALAMFVIAWLAWNSMQGH